MAFEVLGLPAFAAVALYLRSSFCWVCATQSLCLNSGFGNKYHRTRTQMTEITLLWLERLSCPNQEFLAAWTALVRALFLVCR